VFLLDFYSFFVEDEDVSSNDDKDIFGSTHPMLLMKQEAKHFSISTGISGDCHHNADPIKLELNTDEDEGMLQIC
jgi:hypothetical protein